MSYVITHPRLPAGRQHWGIRTAELVFVLGNSPHISAPMISNRRPAKPKSQRLTPYLVVAASLLSLLTNSALAGHEPIASSPLPTSSAVTIAPSSSTWRTPDPDGDGLWNTLEIDIPVNIHTTGRYAVMASLQTKSGQTIANRPFFLSNALTVAYFSGTSGPSVFTLRFSGQQIRDAKQDGPWQVRVYVNGTSGAVGEATLATPKYQSVSFGEPAR